MRRVVVVAPARPIDGHLQMRAAIGNPHPAPGIRGPGHHLRPLGGSGGQVWQHAPLIAFGPLQRCVPLTALNAQRRGALRRGPHSVLRRHRPVHPLMRPGLNRPLAHGAAS